MTFGLDPRSRHRFATKEHGRADPVEALASRPRDAPRLPPARLNFRAPSVYFELVSCCPPPWPNQVAAFPPPPLHQHASTDGPVRRRHAEQIGRLLVHVIRFGRCDVTTGRRVCVASRRGRSGGFGGDSSARAIMAPYPRTLFGRKLGTSPRHPLTRSARHTFPWPPERPPRAAVQAEQVGPDRVVRAPLLNNCHGRVGWPIAEATPPRVPAARPRL